MQKMNIFDVKGLSNKALGVLTRAEMMVKHTGKETFQFADLLAWMPDGKTALYSALNELKGTFIEYTPARNGCPAEYRLAFQHSENQNACSTNIQTTIPDQKNEKRAASQHTGFQFSAADMLEITEICGSSGLNEGFVMSIVTARMTQFCEDAPAFDVLRQRIDYAITRGEAVRSFPAYVRTIFLKADFLDPENFATPSSRQMPQRRPAEKQTAQNLTEPAEIWKNVLQTLQQQINAPTFNTWIRPCRMMTYTKERVKIGVPDETFLFWLNEHYVDLFAERFHNATGSPATVSFEVMR